MKSFTFVFIISFFSSSIAFADSIPEVTVTGTTYTSDNPWNESDTYAWKRQMANEYYAEQARRQNAARAAANAQAKKRS